MLLLVACLCLMGGVPLTKAYSTGPPVSSVASVCTDMVPSGHGVAAMTSAAPFEVVTNADCYKSGMTVQVVVKTLSSSSSQIEGLFVQARDGSSTTAQGSFAVSDTVLSSLTCTTANSAVGHNKEVKAYWREMVWTPPAITSDIKFRATIVEHFTTFYTNVESATLTYNASCVAGNTLMDTRSGVASFASSLTFILGSLMFVALTL